MYSAGCTKHVHNTPTAHVTRYLLSVIDLLFWSYIDFCQYLLCLSFSNLSPADVFLFFFFRKQEFNSIDNLILLQIFCSKIDWILFIKFLFVIEYWKFILTVSISITLLCDK